MRPVGGYFQWEIVHGCQAIHREARLALKSGRACLRCLLECERPDTLWIPYYTCDAVLEPVAATSTTFRFYGIDGKLEIEEPLPGLKSGDRLLYINYFGLKTEYATALERRFGRGVWIDGTHAWFHEPANPTSFYFNSARKFFGVPDGAYLYAPKDAVLPPPDAWPRNTDYRVEHLVLRLQGKVAEGHSIFQDNERRVGGEIARMSALSESLLSLVDFQVVRRRRQENYAHLHGSLKSSNRLPAEVLSTLSDTVPFCYPYLPPRDVDRQSLWRRQIYVPILWRECLHRSEGFAWEKRLSGELLALPVDHRYSIDDMNLILEAVHAYAC